jgi:hypothetical protein
VTKSARRVTNSAALLTGNARLLWWVGMLLAWLLWPGVAVQANVGAPYPVLLEQAVGPYVVSALADPDVGAGTFIVQVLSAEGTAPPADTVVTLWVTPQDGHADEAGRQRDVGRAAGGRGSSWSWGDHVPGGGDPPVSGSGDDDCLPDPVHYLGRPVGGGGPSLSRVPTSDTAGIGIGVT